MTIKAVQGKVIVKPIQQDRVMENGLYLPDQAVGQPDRGIVVSSDHPDIDAGDTALFGKNAGAKIQHEGEDFFVLHPAEILAAFCGEV